MWKGTDQFYHESLIFTESITQAKIVVLLSIALFGARSNSRDLMTPGSTHPRAIFEGAREAEVIRNHENNSLIRSSNSYQVFCQTRQVRECLQPLQPDYMRFGI
jgi:hypothetical protein